MLTIYENRSGALERQKGKPRMTETAVWVDLLNPTPEEEKQIERALKLDVPTREEQQEIEVSSRLYQEGGAYFMTATLMYQPEEGEPRMTPVTFILAGQRLITLRYAEPRAFSLYVARCNRAETDLKTGAAILIGLLETIIDRLADFIERIQAEVEGSVAFDLRDQGRDSVAPTPLRRAAQGDRARGRDHLEGPRKRAFAGAAAYLSRACRQ